MLTKFFWSVFMMIMLLPLPARSAAGTGSLVFVCHKGMNYSRAEVLMTFKGQLDEPRPIDNRTLFREMLNVIKYDAARYEHTWSKQVFRRALFYPKVVNDDEAVIQWVASSYAGIGYVHEAPRNNRDVEVCGL